MPHVGITMILGRNDITNSVCIDDVPKKDWAEHMADMTDKVRFV